jgi:hypothetical protein
MGPRSVAPLRASGDGPGPAESEDPRALLEAAFATIGRLRMLSGDVRSNVQKWGTRSCPLASARRATERSKERPRFVTVRASTTRETMAESDEDLRGELARLKAENEALKAKERRGTRLQVSEKGGVSLYGMRRFPVTFYREEWERILDMADEIRAFIRENAAALKTKSRDE